MLEASFVIFRLPPCLARFRQTTPKATAGYVVYAGDLTPEVAADRFLNFQAAGTIAGRG